MVATTRAYPRPPRPGATVVAEVLEPSPPVKPRRGRPAGKPRDDKLLRPTATPSAFEAVLRAGSIVLPTLMCSTVVMPGLSAPEARLAWSIIASLHGRKASEEFAGQDPAEWSFEVKKLELLAAVGTRLDKLGDRLAAVMKGCRMWAPGTHAHGAQMFDRLQYRPGATAEDDGRVRVRLSAEAMSIDRSITFKVPISIWRSLRRQLSVTIFTYLVGRLNEGEKVPFALTEDLVHKWGEKRRWRAYRHDVVLPAIDELLAQKTSSWTFSFFDRGDVAGIDIECARLRTGRLKGEGLNGMGQPETLALNPDYVADAPLNLEREGERERERIRRERGKAKAERDMKAELASQIAVRGLEAKEAQTKAEARVADELASLRRQVAELQAENALLRAAAPVVAMFKPDPVADPMVVPSSPEARRVPYADEIADLTEADDGGD